jgi:hypothetical protein
LFSPLRKTGCEPNIADYSDMAPFEHVEAYHDARFRNAIAKAVGAIGRAARQGDHGVSPCR